MPPPPMPVRRSRLSFVLGAFACAFAGLCYAEMASTVPIAGSAYTYAYATLGEFIAWIIGWDLILEYALGATTVAIGWSGYVVSFLKNFGIVVPADLRHRAVCLRCRRPRLACDRRDHQSSGDAGGRRRSPTLLVVGIRESARVNNVIVAIKLVIVVLFIAVVASSRQHRKLGDREQSCRQLHSAECRARTIRHQRRAARRRRRVLCLYRLRCGFDRGAGGEESRSATCRSAFSVRSRSAPCSTSRSASCSPGSCAYDKLNVSDPIAVGIDAIGLTLAVADHQIRHRSRPDLGHPGHAARPVARLLFDGARWVAAAGRRPSASAVSHARMSPRSMTGIVVDDPRRPAADRPRRRTGQHRHPVCLRHRLPRRAGVAHQRARPAAPVPDAGGLCRRAVRRGVSRCS